MAKSEGLFLEPSSATGLGAIQQLAQTGRIGAGDPVVTLLTASGLKDPATTAPWQGEMLALPADRNDAMAALRAAKVFPH